MSEPKQPLIGFAFRPNVSGRAFVVRWSLTAALTLLVAQRVYADSALPLLSGFDQQRIDDAYPIRDELTASETGKLVYRLLRLDDGSLLSKATPRSEDQEFNLGDVVAVEGVILEIGTWPLPEDLVEFLEFESLQQIALQPKDAKQPPVQIVTARLPADAKADDRLVGVGVIIEMGDEMRTAVAAGRMAWYPAAPESVGVRLLAERDVDVAALADVATRDRKPLLAEDADLFYSMIGAAETIANASSSTIEPPQPIDPVTLLSEPSNHIGQWMQMDLNTVRITRISVTSPERQTQIGGDHYFQIDSSGDLGDVVVQIARPPGQAGEPIRFESSYPVSVVVKSLPAFLETAIREQEGGNAVSTMIGKPIQVEGFFFRLWSYESDYMQRKGGGEQFGPLVIAARIRDRDMGDLDPVGVRLIGWLAAVAVVLSILATFIWSKIVAGRDRVAKEHRKEREAEHLQLPDDLPT